MQRVFESSGYQFTIITPNGSEPHFIAKEVSASFGYKKSSGVVQYFRDHNLATLSITKENGLPLLKMSLGSIISKHTSQLSLLPASSLQEYLVQHSTRPKAKEIGDRLYEIFVGSNPVFNPEVLDDWGTSMNHQFKLEESLMQRVFESSGYQFTIITPNGGEPHFIAKEIAEALGYSKSFSLSQYFRDKLIVTKENGLPSIKNVLGELYQRTSKLALIPSSSLQEYLVKHASRPKAKELGDILYKVLASGNPVFNPEVLDDWGTSIEELTLTAPQLADVSKKINGFIFGLIKNDRVSKNLSQGYHNTTMAHFVYNVDAVRKEFKEMGVSSTLVSSRRVFLGYLDITSRQVIAFIDDMFMDIYQIGK